MSEMTTAEMVAWLKDEDGAGAETTNAIAARLSELDASEKASFELVETHHAVLKELTAATARAEKAETELDALRVRLAACVCAHDAARREAGL